MRQAIIVAALTLAAVPVVAQAQPYGRYESRDNDDVVVRSVEVYTGDLNLSDPRDAREAERRIGGAARVVCEPRPRIAGEAREYRDCRYEAFENAMNDLEAQAGHPVGRGRVIVREPSRY